MRSLSRAGVVVVLVLVLYGCGGSTAEQVDLLTRTGSYPRNEHVLSAAENILAGECMAKKGFSYSYAVDEFVPQVLLDERRRDGFGLFQAYSGGGGEAGVRPASPKRSAAYHSALLGAGDARLTLELPGGGDVSFSGDGCLAEARGRLFGDVETWARVAHVPAALDGRLSGSVVADPAYVSAERAWRACMRKRGYGYQRPGDGYGDLQARYEKEGPSQSLREQEIAVAVADAECAELAGVPSAVREAKLRGLRSLPSLERAALGELTESWLGAVASAEVVVERAS